MGRTVGKCLLCLVGQGTKTDPVRMRIKRDLYTFKEAIKDLIANGCDPDLANGRGKSARSYAPDLIRRLEDNQRQLMREYLVLDDIFKMRFPKSTKRQQVLAVYRLTDWEKARA